MKWTKRSTEAGVVTAIHVVLATCIITLALGGCNLATGAKPQSGNATGTKTDLKTAKAQRGDLTISALGVGTVINDDPVDLSSESAGEMVDLQVQVGDQVAEGTVLARLNDENALRTVDSAQADLYAAEQAMIKAEVNYEELLEDPTKAEILTAQAEVASAEEALGDLVDGASDADILAAQYGLTAALEKRDDLINGPDSSATQDAQAAVERAQNSLWAAQMSRDAKGTGKDIESGAYDQAQVGVLNADLALQQALRAQAELLDEPTEVEIQARDAAVAEAQEKLDDLMADATEADLTDAQARLAKAEEDLEELLEGPSEEEIALSASSVAQSELALAQAQTALAEAVEALETTTITATIDGTVMTVRFDEGDSVFANDTVITLADLGEPHLTVYIDELDMDMLQVGYEVTVLFDALPSQLFTGHVTQVAPELSSAGGLSLVQGTVVLDTDSFAKSLTLPPGLNATVDVIGGHAEDAVLVPVEAVRQVGEDRYAVFVMERGTPRLQFVEVGLQNYTSAEILEGLDGNETVTTGIVEVQ